jgi:hypothetical protein
VSSLDLDRFAAIAVTLLFFRFADLDTALAIEGTLLEEVAVVFCDHIELLSSHGDYMIWKRSCLPDTFWRGRMSGLPRLLLRL